ncbi:MAG TPA: DUF1579 domain-containing protein [Isosphaeraceae bacterium]|jgi:hypothetical protein|nr:DUF1579 domain-containing protein [Isosphaeraceae bacterium]
MLRRKLAAATTAVTLAVFLAGVWALQADDTPAFPFPKPGPEHEILKKEAGVWDASVEMSMPDGKTNVSKGVETNTMLSGGIWVVTNFKGKMMGQDFEGSGVSGYDPNKKKYVGTWVDSMTTGISRIEQTYDAATKTMSGWLEAPDEQGKMLKSKTITEWKDDNNRIFTLALPSPDGKESATVMRITYKRRSR